MYGFDTTTEMVLEGHDLSGRLAVITGASSGLGRETARALASHGAAVVLAGRDEQRLAAARRQNLEQVPGGDVSTCRLDLTSLAEVRTAADERHTTLGDPDARRVSSSRVVNTKCPRWLVPNCISNPSVVRANGHAITPALLIRRSISG